jgi:5-formyltetrahydrofolate cyclo-ligase
MDIDVTPAAQKAQARAQAFARRKAAFDNRGDAALQANAHLSNALSVHGGRVLAGYMPMRSEIDPLPAMQAHAGPLCVPVIMAKDTPLAFAAYQPGCAMVAGAFGALIPQDLVMLIPDLLIVPLLAFDRRGYRLGYGGGFYDRTLQMLRAQNPNLLAIGFGFAAQEIPKVPIDAFDQRLDMMITESEVICF